MITQEENNLLTQIGRGTPCGDLMRCYWQVVALTEELAAGGAPLEVKLLGEELVLFRDDQGRPGLLGLHCSHRGADLSYGRVEDGGLRCIYHGWLYDIHGRVLDQPGEPGGGAHRDEICHLAYPCQERGGVIFAYLSRGEPPLLPNYEFLNVPEEYRTVTKTFQGCNYLQGNEGNIDPVHLSFLHQKLEELEKDPHRIVRGTDDTENTLLGKDLAPTIEVDITDFGVRIITLRKSDSDNCYVRVTNFILPNLSAFGGSTVGKGYSVHWHVPIDDTCHWKYIFMFSRETPLDDALRNRSRAELEADYRLTRNSANRYRQDRESMVSKAYTGIGINFQSHDAYATESQGPVQDRTMENLVSSDKAIVAARKLLLNAIQDVQEGKDPQHVVRDAKANSFAHLTVISEVISASTNWKQYASKFATASHPKTK